MERKKYLESMLEFLKKEPHVYRRMIKKIEKELENVGARQESSRV